MTNKTAFATVVLVEKFQIYQKVRKMMGTLECKDFSTQADEVMTPNNAKVEMMNVGGQRVMKISAQPGWKWSKDVKPMVGTESCQAKHVGVIVEGSITCRHDDGS